MLNISRPRRNRKTDAIRRLVRETHLSPNDLIAPLFLKAGQNLREPIHSMPGVFRYSIDELIKECRELHSLGVPCVSLFPVIEDRLKDARGSEAVNANGLYQQAIRGR